MILLEDLREDIRGILGSPCMLRVSRQEKYLLVTDFERRYPDGAGHKMNRLCAAGWTVRPDGGVWQMDPGDEKWLAIIRSAPAEAPASPDDAPPALYSLVLRLTKTPVPAELQPVAPLRFVLKAIDRGDAAAAEARLPAMISVLLRQKKPMPEAVGRYLNYALRNQLI